MTKETGEPAFPLAENGKEYSVQHGMSLRDYFAAAAMQGMLANPKLHEQILKMGGAYGGWLELSAWAWADGMLEERDAS